jgi:hypothetical protein
LSRAQLQTLGISNDGVYSIPVSLTDNVNNVSTGTISLTVLNTPPAVTVSQPLSAIYSGNISILWSASDPASGDYPLSVVLSYSNGTSSGTITSGTAISNPFIFNTSSIPDGTGYNIYVKVSDDDSSTTSLSPSFSVDKSKPQVNT